MGKGEETKPSGATPSGELHSTILDAIRGNIEELKAMASRLEGADPGEMPEIDFYAKNSPTIARAPIDAIE